jgi:hypothetical protein
VTAAVCHPLLYSSGFSIFELVDDDDDDDDDDV